MKEWSLVVTSVFVQAATGLWIALAAIGPLMDGAQAAGVMSRGVNLGMVAVGPIILVGMVASLFHLGNPSRAYRSIARVGTSWLSREVVFMVAFFAAWLLWLLLDRSGRGAGPMVWVTALAGLACVLSMARIYVTIGRPGWDGVSTYGAFLGTLVVFGGVGAAVALAGDAAARAARSVAMAALAVVLVLLAARLVLQLTRAAKLKPEYDELSIDHLAAGADVAPKAVSQFRTFSLVGWALSSAGACAGLGSLLAGAGSPGVGVALAGAALALAGEILGRCGFYEVGLSQEEPSEG